MSDHPPRLIADRYLLISELGQGGMGRVWAARDELLARDVAVKELVLPPGLGARERDDMRQRAVREARAIARLNHPNVVRIFDVAAHHGEPWIIMELVRSRPLHEVLVHDGPLPPEQVARIGLAVLAALRAAHQAGLLHRDVKPANVLLAADGRVVLTDFGLAVADGDSSMTHTGIVLGSPSYLAPERALDLEVGPAADLWSLGATLYAAVEGTPPYSRSSAIATLAALATEPPRAPRQAGVLTPALRGLLARDPAQRVDAAAAERLLHAAAFPVAGASNAGSAGFGSGSSAGFGSGSSAGFGSGSSAGFVGAGSDRVAAGGSAGGAGTGSTVFGGAGSAVFGGAGSVGVDGAGLVGGSGAVPAPRPRRRRLLIGAGAALLVLVAALAGQSLISKPSGGDGGAAAAGPAPLQSSSAATRPARPSSTPADASKATATTKPPSRKPPSKAAVAPAPSTGPRTTAAAPATSFVNMMTGKCLDLPDGGTIDVQMWDCNGTGNQQFAVNADRTVRVQGRCLEVRGTGDGSHLGAAPCSGASAQLFAFNSSFDLVSVQADKCVDVPDGNAASGMPVQIWQCTGATNQKWQHS